LGASRTGARFVARAGHAVTTLIGHDVDARSTRYYFDCMEYSRSLEKSYGDALPLPWRVIALTSCPGAS
jgi:hypothetical protein